MRVSFEIFFSICYYYYYYNYYYYFTASRSWFLTYIYSNFENTFFGLSNLEFFIQSLSASNICLSSFFSFLSFIFFYIYYYHYYNCLCLCVLCVYRPCWETYKISSRFESFLYLYLRIFYFCIAELWVLVNMKYRKENVHRLLI